MSLSQPNTTLNIFRRRSSGDLSGPRSEGRNGTSRSLAFVKGKRSIFCVFLDSSGLLSTSFRKADEPYLEDDAAEEADRMETLSRDVPASEDVPDEKTVPEAPPELLSDRDPTDGLSYR